MRLQAQARGRGGAGAVLEGLHPGHRPRVPQAHHRSARAQLPIWAELVDGARYVDDRLREIFDEVRPDVIVQDNVVAFPAVPASGIPGVRIVSCNPLEVGDPGPAAGLLRRPHGGPNRVGRIPGPVPGAGGGLCGRSSTRSAGNGGAPRARRTSSSSTSRRGSTCTCTPPEADYPRTRPLGERWHRLDSCVRSVDEPFEPPPGDGALVYVSLGSLGSADVELMNRLVAALAETPHRYVVSKGPQHESIELAPNMTGAEFLPQPAILPQADLVITHGGNNTVTESIHFGKPMIVLPLVLGPVRQRAARRGGRLRRTAADLRVRGRRAARARSNGCSRAEHPLLDEASRAAAVRSPGTVERGRPDRAAARAARAARARAASLAP